MRQLSVMALLVLTACGASGPPQAPTPANPEPAKPGLVMSGEASVGIARNGTK
ncbi:MAG: argininosuccinate lyase [Alphaproteobacteria bacterium]